MAPEIAAARYELLLDCELAPRHAL